MKDLSSKGIYTITDDMKKLLCDFDGEYSPENEVFEVIKKYYEECGYVMDTHTAVAACGNLKYKEKTGDDTVSVVVSTASPYKFTRSVMKAIAPECELEDDFEMIKELSSLAKVAIPNAIKQIMDAKILHDTVCKVEEMESSVIDFLSL